MIPEVKMLKQVYQCFLNFIKLIFQNFQKLIKKYQEKFLNIILRINQKLFLLYQDQISQNIISWVEQGTAFATNNQEQLEKIVLKKFFKHSNYSSFVRQLNIYGFQKVRSQDGFIFKHNLFRKGMIEMLQYIKKKNQKHQVIPLQIEEEQEFHLQKQQDQFKGFAIDIKQTNKQLKEDMKVLQETSKQLMEQIQNLGYFIQNQNSDVELKLKQVGQMLSIITEELQSENKKDVQQTNKSVIRIDQFFQDSKVNSPNPYVDYTVQK